MLLADALAVGVGFLHLNLVVLKSVPLEGFKGRKSELFWRLQSQFHVVNSLNITNEIS